MPRHRRAAEPDGPTRTDEAGEGLSSSADTRPTRRAGRRAGGAAARRRRAPTDDDALAAALEQPVDPVHDALDALAQRYTADGRGIDLRRVGDGWRFYTRDPYAPYVERLAARRPARAG